jgi:hypothetical protein
LPIAACEWFVKAPVLCVECDEENVREFGFSYVDRKWLVPFATRCDFHGTCLAEFPEWSPGERGLARSIPALPGREVAAAELLSSSSAVLDGEALLDELGSLLQSRGYSTKGGNLRRKKLCELLQRYAAGRHEHPELDRLMSSASAVERALRPLWSNRGCLHPIVATELRSALRQEAEVAPQLPFKVGERNDKRQALAMAVMSSATVTEAARKAGVCVTTASLAAQAVGLAIRHRHKVLNQATRFELERLLATGLPVESAARYCSVSLSSAYRVLATNLQLQAQRATLLQEEKLCTAREVWLRLIRLHSGLGISGLRQLQPATFALLYRADRTWLREVSPSARRDHSSSRARRTPAGVDPVLARRVLDAAKAIALEVSPARATASWLMAAAGAPRRCAQADAKPLANRAVQLASESLEAFVYRRLSQAAADIRNEGHPVVPWRVVRKSRLRPDTILRSGLSVEQVISDTRAAAMQRAIGGK